MGWCAIEVEVIFLYILSMVGFTVGQPEQAFLENRILTIPQGQCEAEALVVIAQAGQPILTPAIGPRAGLIVGEVIPGIAAVAVVLAHRTPLALAQVRSPLLPGNLLLTRLYKSHLFGSHRAPLSFGLEGYAKHGRVMAGDRLQLRLWRRGKRLALPPRVFDGRQEPEVALGIPHDPLLIGPLDKESHHMLWSGSHVVLLWNMVVQGASHLELPLSPVVPGRVAHLLAGGGLGKPTRMR